MDITKRVARASAAALTAAVLASFAPSALAVGTADIGYVDQGAIGQTKPFADAQNQFAQYQSQLRAQFQTAVRGKSDADKQRIFQDFNQRAAAKQQELFGPLLARAQSAIARVAAQRNLSIVVDKQIMVFGGTDITKDVLDTLANNGPIVPPVNTPPPATIGYVDQQQIDALPKVKLANDDFLQFRSTLQSQLNQQLSGKSQDQQKQIIESFNKQLEDRRKKVLDPVVYATEGAIRDVAQKRNLSLVIDATNRVYGGIDVTADVVKALQ